jgi:hypothetical protein
MQDKKHQETTQFGAGTEAPQRNIFCHQQGFSHSNGLIAAQVKITIQDFFHIIP